MSKLKQCPFCGSNADLDWGGATDIGGSLHQCGWVCCTNPDCDANVEVDSINDSKSSVDLANKWNRRAETEAEKRLTTDRQNAISLMSKSWQHDSEKQDDLITRYVTMAENQFKKKGEEIERLTAIATKHATRCDELYGALEKIMPAVKQYLEYEHDGDPWTEDARSMGEMDLNELDKEGVIEEILSIIDKSRTEADK